MAGKVKWAGFLFLIFLTGMAHPGFAHVRHYVWSTEYQTLPKNTFELENYVTLKVPHGEASNVNQWEYQEELEYAATDHFSLAHYERWETVNQTGKDSTKYAGFKFEGKYRVGERGKYWLDPLLYVEWATDPREDHNPNEIETKLVLSKDVGGFNVTYNQIMDSKLGSGGRTEHEFTIGTNYELLPGLRAGAEMKGQYWNPGSNRNELALGPTLAYEWTYFWVAAGGLFGVNHTTDDYQARIIVGITF